MTVETLNKAINGVDENMVEQALTQKPAVKKAVKYVAIAAAFMLCLLGGARWLFNALPLDTDKSGGETSESINAKSEIKISGVGFTAEEIERLIAENKEHITQAVYFEYGLDNVAVGVSTKGYSHVVCGEENSINLDAITLPVVANGNIVANIELVKTNGETVFTLNIGGEKWGKYNEALLEEPDRQVAFAFAGNGAGEVIILPNNSTISVTGDSASLFSEGENWYSLLKTEYNSLSYNELEENLLILDEASQAILEQETEASEKETSSSQNNSSYSQEKMYLSTQFAESMGKAAKALNSNKAEQIADLLSELNLQERDTPKTADFPTGGGIILRNGEDEYIFYSSEIIELNGKYYETDDISFNNLIQPLTEILR